MVSYSTLQQALASNAAITCRCGLIVRINNRFRTVKFDNDTMSIIGGDINEAWIIGTNPEAITTIDLHHNRLTSFPHGLDRARNLQLLNLSNNRITEVPRDLPLLPHLEELHLNGNNLASIAPRALCMMPELTHLMIHVNPALESLPDTYSLLLSMSSFSGATAA
jgi:Leucine-rich repeat (LRR) protein